MFGSTILDVAIGLIFTFLMISLVTSAATEALASGLSWRANTLLQGVKDLLNDPQFTGLARDLYNHDLVNSLDNGTAGTQAQLGAKPSYIDPKQFASALIDRARLVPGADVQAQQASVNIEIQDPQLQRMLNGMIQRASGNIDRIHDDIAGWFDAGMQRVSGAYKRKTQLWGFLMALLCAIALNVDTIKIAEALWNQPIIMKGISAPKTGETAKDAVDQLSSLGVPFGWDQKARDDFPVTPSWIWLFALAGWLITAVTTLFGAPFWFDTLQRFVQLRGAGPSKPGTGAA